MFSFWVAAFPNPIYAQKAGESCCPGGYTYGAGGCVSSSSVSAVCSVASNAACVLARASVGGWTQSFDSCVTSLENGCASAVNWSNNPIDAANSYCNFVMTTTWGAVLFGGNFLFCATTIQPVLSTINIITREPSCDSGFECSSAGTCAEPGTAPGTTIPVYNPECDTGVPSRFREDSITRTMSLSGVKTALGCLPVDPGMFVEIFLPWAVYLGAGLAFLLGVFGAMMIVLSAGNPEKMQAGKEMITSAVAGVVILVFAVFLLDFIGVKVLKLFSF